MKGEDIKAGSNFILSNNKGRIAPVVAAKVVIDIKLMPTAEAIKGPSPCHQAKAPQVQIRYILLTQSHWKNSTVSLS